ncbi:hypothetical protein LCGC14_0824670 [marine sediment metagenome]|uniref:Uncharacterized protein n=1 Tax=marine sediment metagenome TaxID=412755 RepID=A0A0F9S2M3_9ZZZZ
MFNSFINDIGGPPSSISKLEYILKNYVSLEKLNS